MLLRPLLQELGLKSWLKTTGGEGLHLFVPLKPEHNYEAVKRFSQKVVEHMTRTIPLRFVAKSGPRNRAGRIFIDYLRNGWVQSTAETFSARARPGLGVSMPVDWAALPAISGGAHWNINDGTQASRPPEGRPVGRLLESQATAQAGDGVARLTRRCPAQGH